MTPYRFSGKSTVTLSYRFNIPILCEHLFKSIRFCFSRKSKFSLLKTGACLIHVPQLIVQIEDLT